LKGALLDAVVIFEPVGKARAVAETKAYF